MKLSLILFLQNFLLEGFVTLPNHINYLHFDIEDVTTLYFYHNLL